MKRVNYSDLIGLPWARLKCYQVVRELYARGGVLIAAEPDFSEWFPVSDAPQFGDVLSISKFGNDISDSTGVYVDDGKVLTSMEAHGVCVISLRSINGKILGRYRKA